MSRKHHLADLQLAIMHILWDRGTASVAEVREALEPERKLAHTTVGTMLAKLEEKGQVTHDSDGRVNIYRAIVKRGQVRRTMLADLANRLFRGNVKEMVCQLLNGAEMTRDELAELKRVLREKEREL